MRNVLSVLLKLRVAEIAILEHAQEPVIYHIANGVTAEPARAEENAQLIL